MDLVIEASSELVACALRDPGWAVVDARDSDTFIGWSRGAECRGGHIKGTKLFSAAWLNPFWEQHSRNLSQQLEFQLESQGILPGKNLIICDENREDAARVCAYLSERGFHNLFYFSLQQWEGEWTCYPNYRLLAPVWWVKDLIDGQLPQSGSYRIFEISWKQPSPQYLAAHIPGAVHIDSEEFEVGPAWVRVDDRALERFAAENGITPDTTVVIYGNRDLGAPAKLSAVLRYLGVRNVMCLNGTLHNWLAAGYPTEAGCRPKCPCTLENGAFTIDPFQIVDLEEAKLMLKYTSLGTLIDTRRWSEYIGQDSGYDYVPKAGRIPGSIWCFHPTFFSGPDRTMGNADVMCRAWESAGIDRRKRMAFFCGSASWGAAVEKLYGNVAGYDNATIFEGGWCQWQLDDTNPYETGVPESLRDYDPEEHYVGFTKGTAACHTFYKDVITLI